MSHRIYTVLAALAVTAAAATAQSSAPPGWSAVVDGYRAAIQRAGVQGSSLLVVRDGAVVARHTEGFQDAERRVLVTDDTIYHWASITKTFTGIAIMQLRDRGLLSLDDPVGQVRAGAAARAQPVRRHLAGEDPPPDVAQRRLPRLDMAVGRRQAVAPVRAGVLGRNWWRCCRIPTSSSRPDRSTATPTPASSFSAGSSSCCPATTTRSTSPRTS